MANGQGDDYQGVIYPIKPTYGLTGALWAWGTPMKRTRVQRPAEKYMCFDSNHQAIGEVRGILTSNVCGQWTCGANVSTTHNWVVNHNGGDNLGYIDGHSDWRKADVIWSESSVRMDPTLP